MAKFVLTAQLQLQAPKNVQQVVRDIEAQLNNINVDVRVRGAVQASKSVQDLTKSTNEASSAATKMGKSFQASVRRFTALAIATRAVSLFTNTLGGAIKESIAFERELIKIAQVTGKTVSGLSGLTNTISSLSTNLGVSSTSLLGVSRILAQTGLSARDTEIALGTLARTELAPTFDDITQTAEGAVAILNQFGQGAAALEAQLGSLNAVAGQFAVEAGDLVAVIRRTGGVFKSAGGDLNQLIALFTSVRATTRESAESIATGLRTIFTRIQRPETIDYLRQFGVELVDLEGKFVGPYKAIELLSKALAGLGEGDLTFIQIAEELGGFRQIGKVLPLIQQFAVAQDALKVAQEGQGSLASDAAKAQAALAIQIAKVQEEFSRLVRDVTATPTFQIMADTALNLASALIKLADTLKPIIPLLTAFAAIKAFQGVSGFLGGLSGNLGGKFNQGGKVLAFSRGGSVPGTGNRDTVPAMLTPGEFVVKKSSAQKIGQNNLAKLNTGGYVAEDLKKHSQSSQQLKSAVVETDEQPYKTGLLLNKDDTLKGNITYDKITKRKVENDIKNKKVPQDTMSKLLSQNNQEKGTAFEAYLAQSGRAKYQKTSGNHPVDFTSGAGSYEEAKNIQTKLPEQAFIDKLFRARVKDGSYSSINEKPSSKGGQNLDLGSLKVFTRAFNSGGLVDSMIVQKFATGTTGSGARRKGARSKEEVAAMLAEAGIDTSSPSAPRGQKRGDQRKGERLNKTFGLASLYGIRDSAPQDTVLPVTGNIVKTQYGVLDEAVSQKYEDQMRSSVATTATSIASDLMRNIGSKPKSPGDVNSLLDKAGLSNAVGTFFESALALTGAPYEGGAGKTQINDSMDFPTGLGPVASQFGLPSNIPTDATRTSGSKGKGNVGFAAQVERFLFRTGQLAKPLQLATGGVVPGVGNRDTVPATLQQGDFVIRKRSVQSIGAGNLQKMAGYNSGGKTTDVPALLTPGEFVFSKSQAQKVGYGKLNRMNKVGKYAKGGIVQKFASGTGSSGAQPSGSGSVGINIDTSGLTSAFESLVGSIDDIVNQLNSFKQSTQDVADANEKQVDSSKRVADADSDLERQYQKTMVSQARLAAFVGAAATGFTMLTPTIDETSGYMDYLMKNISELGLQLVAAYGIIERFQLLDPDKLQRVAGYLDSGLSSLGKKFTDLREAVNNPIQAFGQLQSSISASSAANVAESAASVESASADTVEAAASMAAAKADAAEAASGGGGFFSNLLKSSGFKQFLKIGAVATTVASAFYIVNKAAADLAKRLKETAIEEGNIEEAGRLAAVEAGARNSAAGSAAGALGGAAIGAAIGSAIAPVIGTAIGAIIGGLAAGASDTFGEFVRTLFGGKTTKSIIAMSRASAAAANASKKLRESQEKVNKAMEKFRNGTATATDVMLASSSGIQAAAQARIEADKAVAENSKNLSDQFSSFFRYLGAWLTLGFVDTGAERNAKIESENKKITQEAEAAEKQAAAQSMQAVNPLMRQVAAAGGSFEDFRRRMTATAKGTQIFNMIMKHSGEELRDSFNNLSEEAERTRAAFEAMNLGMRGVQGSASALELEISNIFRRTDGSISGLESTIATLEAGITSAAESMSDDTWSSAVDSASGALRMLGADQQSIKKFEENMNAINAAQRTFADSFGEARQKLENEFLRGASQGGTVPQRQQALANAVADNLPAQIGDDVRERIRSAINNAELDDDQQRKLIAGDVSVLDDVLKELGETTLSQVIEPFKQLNNVLNERIAANDKLLKLERQLVDAKLKAIDVEIEAAELVAKYSDNSPFTEVNRREKIIEKGNIATEGLGLTPIVQGTRAEFETRNRQAQSQSEYVANTRETAAGDDAAARAAQATIRTDEFRALESNLERFVNAELATKRALIKSMEAEIKAVEAKTAAEKKATDNLLSGSYEQFVEQLAAEGAVMAAASGDPNLMRRFSRQDYGRGDKLLEDMQSDGVTNFMGRSMRSLRTDTRAFGLMAGGFSPNAAYARAGMGVDGARDKDGKFISPQIAGIASTMPGTANIDVTRAQGAVGEQERILADVNLRLQKQMEKTNEEIAKNIEALGKNTDALNNNKDKDAQQTSRTTASDSEMASSRVYSDGCCEGVSDVRVTNTGEFPDNSGGMSDLINGVGSVIKVLAPLGALKNLLSKRPPKPPVSPSPRGLGVKPTSTMSRTRTPLSPDDIELPTKPRGPIIDAEFDVRPDPRRIPTSSRPRALDAPDRPLLNGPEPPRLYGPETRGLPAPETRRPTAMQSNALTTIDDVAAPRPTVSQPDDLLALSAPRPAQVASEVVDAVEFGPVTPSVPQTIEDVLPDLDTGQFSDETEELLKRLKGDINTLNSPKPLGNKPRMVGSIASDVERLNFLQGYEKNPITGLDQVTRQSEDLLNNTPGVMRVPDDMSAASQEMAFLENANDFSGRRPTPDELFTSQKINSRYATPRGDTIVPQSRVADRGYPTYKPQATPAAAAPAAAAAADDLTEVLTGEVTPARSPLDNIGNKPSRPITIDAPIDTARSTAEAADTARQSTGLIPDNMPVLEPADTGLTLDNTPVLEPADGAPELLPERGLIRREQPVPRATSSAASSADEGASIFTRGREALNRFGDAAGEYVSRAGTRASEAASNFAGKVSPYIPQSVKTAGGYIGQGVSKVGEFAAKYAKPLAVADIGLGVAKGVTETEADVGKTINNRGLDNRSTTEKGVLGGLTGNAAVGESFTNMALGMERGGTGDQIAATYEAMLSRGLAGATFGGPVGALVGAGSAAGGQVYKAMTLLGQEQGAARQAGARVEGLRTASVDESGLDSATRNLLGNKAAIQLDIKDAEAAGDSEKVAQLEKQLAEAQLSVDKRIEERRSRGGDLYRTSGRNQFSGTLTDKAVEEDRALQAAYLDKEMVAQTEYRTAQAQVAKREQEVSDLQSQQIKDNKVAASTATSGTFDYRTGALQSNMFTPDIEASKAAVQSYEQKIQEAQNTLASSQNFTDNLPDPTDAEAMAAYVVNLDPQLEVDTNQLPANVQSAIDSELQNVETTATTKVIVATEPEHEYDPQAERDFNLQASPEELKSRGIQEIYKEDQGDNVKAGDIKARTPEYETERTRILAEAMNITPSQYEEVVSNSDNALEYGNAFANIPGYTPPDMNQATPSSGYSFSDDLNTQFGLASQSQEIADKVIDGIRQGDVAPDVSQTSTAISDVIPAPAAPGARVESPEAQVARLSAPEPMVAPTTSSDLNKALQQVSDVAVPESSLDLSEASPQEVQSAADSLAASIGEKSVTPDAEASKSAAPGEEGKSKIEGGDPMKPQDAGSCCAETLAILKQILDAIKGIGQYDPSKIDYSPSLIGQSPLTQSPQTDTLSGLTSSLGGQVDLAGLASQVAGQIPFNAMGDIAAAVASSPEQIANLAQSVQQGQLSLPITGTIPESISSIPLPAPEGINPQQAPMLTTINDTLRDLAGQAGGNIGEQQGRRTAEESLGGLGASIPGVGDAGAAAGRTLGEQQATSLYDSLTSQLSSGSLPDLSQMGTLVGGNATTSPDVLSSALGAVFGTQIPDTTNLANVIAASTTPITPSDTDMGVLQPIQKPEKESIARQAEFSTPRTITRTIPEEPKVERNNFGLTVGQESMVSSERLSRLEAQKSRMTTADPHRIASMDRKIAQEEYIASQPVIANMSEDEKKGVMLGFDTQQQNPFLAQGDYNNQRSNAYSRGQQQKRIAYAQRTGNTEGLRREDKEFLKFEEDRRIASNAQSKDKKEKAALLAKQKAEQKDVAMTSITGEVLEAPKAPGEALTSATEQLGNKVVDAASQMQGAFKLSEKQPQSEGVNLTGNFWQDAIQLLAKIEVNTRSNYDLSDLETGTSISTSGQATSSASAKPISDKKVEDEAAKAMAKQSRERLVDSLTDMYMESQKQPEEDPVKRSNLGLTVGQSSRETYDINSRENVLDNNIFGDAVREGTSQQAQLDASSDKLSRLKEKRSLTKATNQDYLARQDRKIAQEEYIAAQSLTANMSEEDKKGVMLGFDTQQENPFLEQGRYNNQRSNAYARSQQQKRFAYARATGDQSGLKREDKQYLKFEEDRRLASSAQDQDRKEKELLAQKEKEKRAQVREQIASVIPEVSTSVPYDFANVALQTAQSVGAGGLLSSGIGALGSLVAPLDQPQAQAQAQAQYQQSGPMDIMLNAMDNYVPASGTVAQREETERLEAAVADGVFDSPLAAPVAPGATAGIPQETQQGSFLGNIGGMISEGLGTVSETLSTPAAGAIGGVVGSLAGGPIGGLIGGSLGQIADMASAGLGQMSGVAGDMIASSPLAVSSLEDQEQKTKDALRSRGPEKSETVNLTGNFYKDNIILLKQILEVLKNSLGAASDQNTLSKMYPDLFDGFSISYDHLADMDPSERIGDALKGVVTMMGGLSMPQLSMPDFLGGGLSMPQLSTPDFLGGGSSSNDNARIEQESRRLPSITTSADSLPVESAISPAEAAANITSPIQITKPEEFDFDKPEDVERAAKGFGTARAPEGVAPTPTVSKLEVEQASRRVSKNVGVDQKIEAQKHKKPPIITGQLSEEALKQKSQQENIEKAEAKAKEQQENRIKLLPPTVSGGRGGDDALSLSEGIKQTYAPVKKQPGATSDLNPMLKESAESQVAGNDYALEKVEETKPSFSPLIVKKEPVEKFQKLQAQERSRQIFKYLKSDPKTEQLKQPKHPMITGQMSERVLEQKKAQKSIQVEENRKQKSQVSQESSLPASLQGGRGNAISMSESIRRTTEPVRLPSGTLISGNPMNVNRDKSEAINNQQMSGTNPLDTSFDTGNLTASGRGGTPPSAPAPAPMPMSAPAPVSGPTLGTQFGGSLSSGSGGDFSEATTILTSIESVLISIEAKIANNPTLTSKNAGTVGNSAELTTDAFDRSISNLSRIFSDFSSGFNEALSRLESVEIDVRLQPVKVVVDFNGAGIVERLENYVKKELWREVQAEFSQWQIGDDGRLARSGGLRR